MTLNELYSGVEHSTNTRHADVEVEHVQSVVDLLDVVGFGFELVSHDTIIHALKILFGNLRANG